MLLRVPQVTRIIFLPSLREGVQELSSRYKMVATIIVPTALYHKREAKVEVLPLPRYSNKYKQLPKLVFWK